MSDPRDDLRGDSDQESPDEGWVWDVDPRLRGAGRLSAADDVHVGARIRARRHALGLSQQTVAHELGLSYQQLHKYEFGHNRVPAGRLSLIARCLGVPPCYFFMNVGACAQDSVQADATGPDYAAFLARAQSLLVAFRRLSPEQQTVAVRLTQTLADPRAPQNDGSG